MKQFFTLFCMLLIGFSALQLRAEEPVTLPLDYTPDDEEVDNKKDDPDYRQRMPPARILCEIDFVSGSIEGSSPLLADIQSYEIWTEEDDACLFAGATAGEMTAALCGLGEGIHMLKLRGEGYVLIGFIKR